MSERWCETCRFWGGERQHDDNFPYGTCRVGAPMPAFEETRVRNDRQIFPGISGFVDRLRGFKVHKGHWPWTAFDDWCGEHEPAPPEAQP